MDKWTNPAINAKENWFKHEPESNHHLMPSSRADNVQKEAQIMLFESLHCWLHRVFGNATPIEQIYKILSINSPVITKRFTDEIIDMLKDENYVYRKWLRQRKK